MSIRYSNGGREEVENFINNENNHFFMIGKSTKPIATLQQLNIRFNVGFPPSSALCCIGIFVDEFSSFFYA